MQKITNILFLIVLAGLLSACSNDDKFCPEVSPQDRLLQLQVTAGDFVTAGIPSTRAADNGNITTFEDGDRVGMIILDGDNIVANNLPYQYSIWNNQWEFATYNNDNKSLYYYDSGAGTLTYIVYYPYSNSVNGVKNVDELKAQFSPQSDQRSKEAYRASDLMVWTYTGNPLKSLSVELKHAYVSIAYMPEVQWTLEDGKNTNIVVRPENLTDVHFVLDGNRYFFYRANDGNYRYILPANFPDKELRFFHTLDDKSYGTTLTVPTSVAANTRYVCKTTLNRGTYSLDKAKLGDLYCRTESCGYLMPGEVVVHPNVAEIIKEANCIGLVFHAGKHTSDDSDYSGTGIGGSSFHGYVVALQDAGSGLKWEDKNGTYNQAVGASTSETDWKGYSNSQKIRQYVKSTGGWTLADFPAANACFNFGTAYSKYAVPSGNSGWFMPSEGQLKSLYDNRGILSRQIEKLKGISGMGDISWFSSYFYWSSSESQYDSSNAWNVFFDGGLVDTYNKFNGGIVRAVSAF